MFGKKKKKFSTANLKKENVLTEVELKGAMGSGNGQVRYVADEFIQSRILKGRGTK